MGYGTNNILATPYFNGIAFCIHIRSAPNFKSGTGKIRKILCSCGGFKFEATFQLMQCCLGLNLDNISENA